MGKKVIKCEYFSVVDETKHLRTSSWALGLSKQRQKKAITSCSPTVNTNTCIFKHFPREGPASCQHSLLANHDHITHSATHTHTHTHTHTKALFLYAKQVATVTRRRCGALEGVGGDQWAPLVALEHLLSV